MSNNSWVAVELRNAFFEGWNSYSTPCSAYNTPDEAWEKSDTKRVYDSLLQEDE